MSKTKHLSEIKWLPKPYKAKFGRINGEPMLLELTPFANDRTVRGQSQIACCDCGLEHLYTYAVFKFNGTFWLNTRAYRLREKKKRKGN